MEPLTDAEIEAADPNLLLSFDLSKMKECTVCSKPSDRICGNCELTPNADGSEFLLTSYCSDECFDKDKEAHVAECGLRRERRALYRAGKLSQKVFLQMRAKIFKPEITSFKCEDEDLITSFVPWGKDVVSCSFPENVMPTESLRDVQLLAHAQEESIYALYPITKRVLRNIGEDVHEVSMKIHEQPPLLVHHGEKSDFPIDHTAIKLSLTEEQAYIWDLTALQFCLDRPVRTLEQYTDKIKPTIEAERKLGSTWKRSKSLAWVGFEAEEQYEKCYKLMAKELENTIQQWEKDAGNDYTLLDALAAHPDEWREKEDSFLKATENMVGKVLGMLQDGELERDGNLLKIKDYKDPVAAIRAADPDITGDVKLVFLSGPLRPENEPGESSGGRAGNRDEDQGQI